MTGWTYGLLHWKGRPLLLSHAIGWEVKRKQVHTICLILLWMWFSFNKTAANCSIQTRKTTTNNNNKSQKRLQWEVGKTDDSLNIAYFFSMTTWTAECVSKDMRLALITYEKCLIWDKVCTINFLHIFPLNQTFFFFVLTRGHSASNCTLDKGHKAQRCFKM